MSASEPRDRRQRRDADADAQTVLIPRAAGTVPPRHRRVAAAGAVTAAPAAAGPAARGRGETGSP